MGAAMRSLSSASVGQKRKTSEESAATASDRAVSQGPSKRRFITSSSSSVSGQLGYEYDAFLSFRGEDTRKGFADSLYTALEGAGVRVFRDNDSLSVGEEIGPNLLHGIKHSSISIPIFSENYASSKWCLKEFAFMMECRETRKQIVLPIFYDVTPNEVQHQTGKYARAFRQHARTQDPEIVQEWRSALYKVGSVKGWELKNVADGYQGKLIKMIVANVLKELKFQLRISDNSVGLDDKVQAVMGMIDVEAPDVRFVGIWGMGGIGKTTLAKFIYNKISDYFDSYSFLQDIRETWARSHKGPQQLQSQLVAELLKCDHRDFATVDQGTSILERRFRERKVLILLDDVDHVDQLNALAARVDWFGRGSRIIITTRNKDVLKAAQQDHVYEVKEMEEAQALQLFCKHALRRDSPTVELRHLVEEIVRITGGLPLALEVIGSLLLGKRVEVWKATSQKLKKVPNKEVQHKLMISYDALEHEQQQMFLDVACLFLGEDKITVAYFWEDIYPFPPEADIEVLQLMSLIKLGDDNRLRMHDQLRDLGREIVRRENYEEPGKRSRLWGQEAVDVLLNNQGSKSIKVIRLDYHSGLDDCYFTPERFRELSVLRFLQLGRANLAGNFQHVLPELRWLQWEVSQFKCTATNLSLKNLVVLDMSNSRDPHDWSLRNLIHQMMAGKLKVLDLSYCKELTTTPDFHAFRDLERLILRQCRSLEVIDPSIGRLKHLTHLNLEGCRYITELPEQMGKETLLELIIDGAHIRDLPNLEGMKQLKILSAQNCQYLTKIPSSVLQCTSLSYLALNRSEIHELPESIGSLVALHQLRLEGTPVKELPQSIGGLKSLAKLDISQTRVEILPNSMANLVNLEVLKIGRSAVRCLPAALGQLQKLRYIDASDCPLLGEIPENLGGLSALKVLLLRHTNVASIPETIRGLSCLEILDLSWCTQVQRLPELPGKLRRLSLTCQSSAPIPNLSYLINLEFLELVRSTVPEQIMELPRLDKLCISQSHASILRGEIGAFSTLKKLLIVNVNLHCLRGLPVGLRDLAILRSHSLERLGELSTLPNLQSLCIHSCPELVEIEGLEMLEPLDDLIVSSCEKLETLADLSKLRALECLTIRDVPVQTLSGLSGLESLESLQLVGCTNLRGLDGLDELKFLERLILEDLQALESLPNLSKLEYLEELSTEGCENLQGLEGLYDLERLAELNISGCKAIERLLGLSNLSCLERLYAIDCEKLQGLEGLDELDSLVTLDITGCKSIGRLPDLSNLTLLKYFCDDGCEKLQEVQGLRQVEKVKRPDLMDSEIQRCLEADDIGKLRELDGLLASRKLVNYIYRSNERYMTIHDETNLGLLRRWYADGCDKIPELEGLEWLEQCYLRVSPVSQTYQMWGLEESFAP